MDFENDIPVGGSDSLGAFQSLLGTAANVYSSFAGQDKSQRAVIEKQTAPAQPASSMIVWIVGGLAAVVLLIVALRPR